MQTQSHLHCKIYGNCKYACFSDWCRVTIPTINTVGLLIIQLSYHWITRFFSPPSHTGQGSSAQWVAVMTGTAYRESTINLSFNCSTESSLRALSVLVDTFFWREVTQILRSHCTWLHYWSHGTGRLPAVILFSKQNLFGMLWSYQYWFVWLRWYIIGGN